MVLSDPRGLFILLNWYKIIFICLQGGFSASLVRNSRRLQKVLGCFMNFRDEERGRGLLQEHEKGAFLFHGAIQCLGHSTGLQTKWAS